MSEHAKAAARCGKVADEVLKTEQNYVASLQILRDVFYKRLHITCYYPKEQRITSLKHVLALFSNVEDLVLINSELLRELTANAASADQSPLKKALHIADIFLKMGFALMLYRKYLANYSSACVLPHIDSAALPSLAAAPQTQSCICCC